MIAFGLDGTLTPYSWDGSLPLRINYSLLAGLSIDRACVVTNQGGLPFVCRKPEDYPFQRTPDAVVYRLFIALSALACHNIALDSVHISLYHPEASSADIRRAQRQLREALGSNSVLDPLTHLYSSQRARKPSPYMLTTCGASWFYGDSDEDEQAATAIGMPFTRVERFV